MYLIKTVLMENFLMAKAQEYRDDHNNQFTRFSGKYFSVRDRTLWKIWKIESGAKQNFYVFSKYTNA